MIKYFINSMTVDTVSSDGSIYDVSEVEILVWELDEDNPHVYDKHKTLHVAAIYDQEDPEANFIVADNSVVEALKAEEAIYVYESYSSPLEYRNSSYEEVLSVATGNLNAMGRAYHDSVGTLDGMMEDYGA